VGTVRIIVTEGLDSLHTDKTTPHAKPEYIRKVNIWQAWTFVSLILVCWNCPDSSYRI